MQYVSTRGATPPAAPSDALVAGLAPDGGLFVPERLPMLTLGDFAAARTLPAVAATLLRPFFAGDRLAPDLEAICAEAFDVDAPLRPLDDNTFLLELFHGPTAAFKDYGARFLAACLRRLRNPGDSPLTIVVVTSGDTGAAVGGAFHHVAGLRVVILYPDGRVSPRQAHQLGAFGDNVRTLRVAGSFDDCQALAKRALNDTELRRSVSLSSANSINLGRLLPQMAYYAHAALGFRRANGRPLNFVIPTGNLGNALAAILAREVGVPIGGIALATNANRVLPEFFAGADYTPRASIATLASAMDVGAPSNFERLRWLIPDEAQLRAAFVAASIDDRSIRDVIRETWQRHRVAVCPHTATGLRLRESLRDDRGQPWAVAATAHPAKFEVIVEPLIGESVPLPPTLVTLLGRPTHAEHLAVNYDSFVDHLRTPPETHLPHRAPL
jgi:threonine synthase